MEKKPRRNRETVIKAIKKRMAIYKTDLATLYGVSYETIIRWYHRHPGLKETLPSLFHRQRQLTPKEYAACFAAWGEPELD